MTEPEPGLLLLPLPHLQIVKYPDRMVEFGAAL